MPEFGSCRRCEPCRAEAHCAGPCRVWHGKPCMRLAAGHLESPRCPVAPLSIATWNIPVQCSQVNAATCFVHKIDSMEQDNFISIKHLKKTATCTTRCSTLHICSLSTCAASFSSLMTIFSEPISRPEEMTGNRSGRAPGQSAQPDIQQSAGSQSKCW